MRDERPGSAISTGPGFVRPGRRLVARERWFLARKRDWGRMSGLRRILWQKLDAELVAARGVDWTQKQIILYGAGGLGLSFMRTYPHLCIDSFIDSDASKHGTRFHALRVDAPESLARTDPDERIVFITSSWHQEIRAKLESLGLTLNRDFFFGNQQAQGRIFFYLPSMLDFESAFGWLDDHGVDSVILRWFENLPEETPADIDLLIRTEQIEALFENPYLTSQPGGVPLEVYWSRPLGQEDELLYYPTWLAGELLSSRRRLPSGAYAPSDDRYLESLAYHVVFHKAERSGLLVSGPAGSPDPSNKYAAKLDELSKRLGIPLELTLEGLWRHLERVDWLPPVDLARRYAEALESPWLKSRVGPDPESDESLLVFVLRQWLCDRPPVEAQVLTELERLGLERVDLVRLDSTERERAITRIRGGNWVETEQSREGGGPAAFAVFFDPAVEAPTDQDRLLRPFCANRKLCEKTDLKQRICKDYNAGRLVNLLHAADDEREAFEYLECLKAERMAPLLRRIEAVRRAARSV